MASTSTTEPAASLRLPDYTLIRSRRRTISLSLRGDEAVVRAPMRTPRREIDDFVRRHAAWLEKQREKQRRDAAERAAAPKLSEEELQSLYERARADLPDRARHYAAMLGVEYNRITIRCQRSRWGSCSAKRNLNFNCLLMLAPEGVRDAVVVHELCHLVEMNHSDRFYALVRRVYPDYDEQNRWLKEHGAMLLARV